MAFDTTRLVEQVTITGCLPTGRFSNDELMEMAYNVMLSEMVPLIIGVREEYYVRSYDEALAAGQGAYLIVSRAIGGTLREAKMIVGNDIIDLTRKDLEEITSVRTGTPEGFYLQGNEVILDPAPAAASGSLRQFYFIRPSRFVAPTSCAQISAIDRGTNTISATLPSAWTTADSFDLVRGKAHHDILSTDLAASGVGSGQITFTSSLPASLAVGDWVCLAEQTCFPFLPLEGHAALVQATAAAALESIGHPNAERTAAKANVLKENLKSILAVRVQGAPKRLAARVL